MIPSTFRTIGPLCIAVVLGLLVSAGCRHINDPDPSGHNNGGHGGGADSTNPGMMAGMTFDYSMYQGGNDVSDWTVSIDSVNASAYGNTNTYHVTLCPRDGFWQDRKIDANGDLEVWAPTPPYGGIATGPVTPLNEWMRWPMSGAPGMHVVLNEDSHGCRKVATMNIIGTETMQTSVGPVQVVHYIEADTADYSANGGGMDLDLSEQWFAPSLGVFLKTGDLYRPGFYTAVVAIHKP